MGFFVAGDKIMRDSADNLSYRLLQWLVVFVLLGAVDSILFLALGWFKWGDVLAGAFGGACGASYFTYWKRNKK
jgi:membrane associated rhomboid family serine protease